MLRGLDCSFSAASDGVLLMQPNGVSCGDERWEAAVQPCSFYPELGFPSRI